MFVKSDLIIVLLCSLLFFLQVAANLVVYYNITHNNVLTPYVLYTCGHIIHVQEKDEISMRFRFSKFINTATCENFDYGKMSRMEFDYTADKKVLTTKFVATDPVEGAWNCTFLHDMGTYTKQSFLWNGERYTATRCWVAIQIEYELSFTISNIAEKSTFIPQFSNKTNVAQYYYKHGDILQLNCGRPYLGERELRKNAKFELILYEPNTREYTVIEGPTNDNISANYTFEKLDDKSTVSCFFNRGTDYPFNRTVQFLWLPDAYFAGKRRRNINTIIDSLRIMINNITFGSSDAQVNVYRGTVGDMLYIDCFDLIERGLLHWDYCKDRALESCVIASSDQKNIPRNFILEKKHNNTTLKCVFTNPRRGLTTSSEVLIIIDDNKIVFPDASDQDTTRFFTVHPPEDQPFKNGDILEFKCVYKYNQRVKIVLEPDYNTTTIVKTNTKPDTTYNIRVYEELRKMEVNDSNVIIKCMVFNEKNEYKSVQEIRLTRLPADDKEQKSDNELLKSVLDQAAAAKENEQDSKGLGDISMRVFLGCGVGIICILIFIIIGVVAYHKKKDKKKEDGTYENLQNETSTPVPFPRGAKLEETYLSPADCEESPYAYSHSYHHRTTEAETYALPYVEKNLDNLYSKPVPKSKRGKEIAAMPIYAAVPPKSQRLKEAQNPGLIYAELQIKYLAISKEKHLDKTSIDGAEHASAMKKTDASYANLNRQSDGRNGDRKDSQYTNVFDNDSYVNSKDKKEYDDYAEPSYCELGKR